MIMTDRLTLDDTARYRIQIQGTLPDHWSSYLSGLTISVSDELDVPVTVLSGAVLDQAALLGVLNNLYNLGYPLLAVEYQHER